MPNDVDLEFQIAPLSERKPFLPTLATWHFDQWGHFRPGATRQFYLERLEEHTGQDTIPTTYVAHTGETVIGSASLVHHDLDTRNDLTPWLASVYVAPEYRGQGVGSTLVRHVTGQVLMLDIERYYLFTYDQQQLYTSLGWERLEETQHGGHDITIMTWTAPRDDGPIINGWWRNG